MAASNDVTTLLAEVGQHRSGAAERLLPLVYDELHGLAERRFAAEPSDHTLQPTAVVHEVYLRLIDQTRASFNDRRHFMAVASTAMRRVLIDHARARNAAKRRPRGARIATDDLLSDSGIEDVDLLALDEALGELEAAEPRLARVVELRFFGGLKFDDIAELMDISAVSAKRDWSAAKGWLFRKLGGGRG